MQIYPMRAVYAAICFAVVPFVYQISYWLPEFGSVLAVGCWVAGVGFLVNIVNVEVWDTIG